MSFARETQWPNHSQDNILKVTYLRPLYHITGKKILVYSKSKVCTKVILPQFPSAKHKLESCTQILISILSIKVAKKHC